VSAEEVELRRVRLVVAYDGSAFHGFARNLEVPTVADTLEHALSVICRRPTDIVGAGRTDAGVHAWGQVVSADLPAATDLTTLTRRLNAICGPTLIVREAEWAPDAGFNARFDALWRHYRYTVLNTPAPSPFLRYTTWHVPQPLDLDRLNLACDPFVGVHDFTSFCRKPKQEPGAKPLSMSRHVFLAGWTDLGEGLLRFEIRANAFCHQMVRSITGTMVEVGLGRRSGGDVLATLRARDRRYAGQVAPPEGLCLWEVGYPF
jgi:tRNA pseudouridine38-40 synthase